MDLKKIGVRLKDAGCSIKVVMTKSKLIIVSLTLLILSAYLIFTPLVIYSILGFDLTYYSFFDTPLLPYLRNLPLGEKIKFVLNTPLFNGQFAVQFSVVRARVQYIVRVSDLLLMLGMAFLAATQSSLLIYAYKRRIRRGGVGFVGSAGGILPLISGTVTYIRGAGCCGRGSVITTTLLDLIGIGVGLEAIVIRNLLYVAGFVTLLISILYTGSKISKKSERNMQPPGG